MGGRIATLTLLTAAAGFSQAGCSSDARSYTVADAGSAPADAAVVILAQEGGAPSGGGEVFGHSDTTLYRLNPESKAVSVVGDFDGCNEKILDIALDEKSNMYGAGDTSLYLIDRTTAKCTLLKAGQKYPNSLSFVPAGTVDPSRETLVGFVDSIYYKIDTSTGAKVSIGSLGTVFESSGDIVSVKGGGTYVTVKNNGNGCNDCLVEIDPKTGAIKQNFGSLGYTDVFGLTFWGGSAYGFTDGGQLFEVRFQGTKVTTAPIAIPAAPAGLSFWGAGSTTSAPLTPIR
ncbi:MAG: hypothetical protein IPG50_16195 [Myxococcales bacterium]|nr:hypothetical protein [Myxococcales bacterium]